MKTIKDIFDIESNNIIKDIKTSSSNLEEKDVFVCVKGVKKDRHKYIKDALKKKPSAIVVSKKKYKNIKEINNVPIIYVEDIDNELLRICKKFYDNPEDKLNIIAVTGTDGKTTTSNILSHILDAGYIGTIGATYKDYEESIDNTTPSLEQRYKILNEFIKRGCKTVVMEVSSEAIYRKRMEGAIYNTSILTNITQDHLNTHKTIENYINCKGQVFLNTKELSILNIDDKNYFKIKKYCNTVIKTYGFNKQADLKIIKYSSNINGTIFEIMYKNKTYKFKTNYLGKYNIYNICACILYLLENKYKVSEIKKYIKKLPQIPGRFEVFKTKKDSFCILDYAHTANGLKQVLELLNSIKQNKIITVSGSAGGRDKTKRKDMGQIILNNSDYTYFTTDDPRYENPKTIIKQMIGKTKKKNYTIELNRSKAISKSIKESNKDDLILIAGKGRDNYMAIKNKKIPYNDYNEIKKYI